MVPIDLYFSKEGDIAVSPSGDIALTQTEWRDDAQAAYVRIMTDPGDWVDYPDLGAGLSRLFGMSQSPETGRYGIDLIQAALDREQRFLGRNVNIDAIPVSWQSIRFDVYITSGSREKLRLSIEQNLGIAQLEE